MDKKVNTKRTTWYVDSMAQYWLYQANLANEKGDYDLEHRRLAKAQYWLDKLNKLEGKP